MRTSVCLPLLMKMKMSVVEDVDWNEIAVVALMKVVEKPFTLTTQTIDIPDQLQQELCKIKGLNWSEIVRNAWKAKLEENNK